VTDHSLLRTAHQKLAAQLVHLVSSVLNLLLNSFLHAAAGALQALSYSQGSKTRYLVRLQLHEPASSSMPALLQLKEGKAAAEAATPVNAGGHGGSQGHADDDAALQPGSADDHGGLAANRRSSE
jgi:hypothetical protein